MLAKITVADYMSEKILSLTKETDVVEAIKKLLRNRITSAPVFDEGGNLIGMFSEKDAMKVILESAYNQSMAGKVADFMSDEIITIEAETSIVDLAEKFLGTTIRSFPVYQGVDLVGVVSRTDVLKALVAIR